MKVRPLGQDVCEYIDDGCPAATTSLKPLVLGQKFAMTLGGIVILLLLVVSLIIFIYLIVISARGWGVLHTVMLCFLFIECWVFMIFSAGVLYRRVGWLEQASTLQNKAVKSEADNERLVWGEVVNPDKPDAVVLAQGELRRLTADRGRVWRQLELVSSDAGTYKLEMKAPAPAQDLAADPAAPAAAAAAAPADSAVSLPANLVVHCFAEEANEQNQALPNYYLGEFKVTASQAGQVTLSPTLPLEPAQIEMVKSGGAPTWALYELLPLDSHTVFAAPESMPSLDNSAIYGRMDEAELTKLFQRIPDGRREIVLKDYLKDGGKADDSDLPATRWVAVKLLKDYSIDVDGTDAIATELGFFDSEGRSVDSRLKRDEEGNLVLTPDTQKRIVLKSEAAEKLISSGMAAAIDPIFVRPLIDYQEAFNGTYVRRHEVNERIAHYQREAAELTKANSAGQEMISFRQIENQQLTADLGNYVKEAEVLQKEALLAEERLVATRAKISEMYRQIQARAGMVSQ